MLRPPVRFLLLPLLLIAAFFSGCENIPKEIAGMEVDIEGIRSFRQTDAGYELVVTVRCRNETVRPIGVRQVNVAVSINGLSIGKGASERPVATQAMSTNTADVVFSLQDEKLVEQIMTSFDRGSINYDLKTQLVIVSGGQHLRARSTASGTIDVAHLTDS